MFLLPGRYLSLLFLSLFLTSSSLVSAQVEQDDVYTFLTMNPEGFRQFLLANPNYVVNLKGADLSGLDMSNMRLRNADLSYANLQNTNLKEADLTGTNFMGSNLTNADFSRCNLAYANFDKTNATGAKFIESTFKNTVMDYLLIQNGYQLDPAFVDVDGLVKPLNK